MTVGLGAFYMGSSFEENLMSVLGWIETIFSI